MPKRHLAFTLVEITVVLAIVMLLAALLFPLFGRVRESGRRTVCLSNQKQIYAAFQLYLADSGGQFPNKRGIHEWEMSGWAESISSHLETPEAFHCPSDEDWEAREKEVRKRDAFPSMGAFAPSRLLASSYIANRKVLTGIGVQGQTFPFRGTLVRPASTVMVCDGASRAFGDTPFVIAPIPEMAEHQLVQGNLIFDPRDAGNMVDGKCDLNCTYPNIWAPTARHNGRANVLFFDGHVKSLLNSAWYFPDTPYLDPSRGG